MRYIAQETKKMFKEVLGGFKDELSREVINKMTENLYKDISGGHVSKRMLKYYFDASDFIRDSINSIYDVDKMPEEEREDFNDWVWDIAYRIAESFNEQYGKEFEDLVENNLDTRSYY